VHVSTQEPLHAIEIERKVRLHSRVPCGEHHKVVLAAQSVWRCLWTLHHLLGICVRVEPRARKSSHLLSVRLRFNIDRMLGPAFALVAAELGDRRYRGGLTLLPLAAEPRLLRETLKGHLAACLADDDFVNAALACDDTLILAYFPLLLDTLIDCAHALGTMFEYVHSEQRPLKLARRSSAASQKESSFITRRAAPLLVRMNGERRGFAARASTLMVRGPGEDMAGGFDKISWPTPDDGARTSTILSWLMATRQRSLAADAARPPPDCGSMLAELPRAAAAAAAAPARQVLPLCSAAAAAAAPAQQVLPLCSAAAAAGGGGSCSAGAPAL
jgi:hypothetical protein